MLMMKGEMGVQNSGHGLERQEDLTISSLQIKWVGIERSRSVGFLSNLPMHFAIFWIKKMKSNT